MGKKYEENNKEKNVVAFDDLSGKIKNSIRGGKNKVYHNVVSEVITLSDGWITTLEQSLFSVENVVRNPKRFISEEDLVVDVERAKRTTARTVRHLSSNSQYIESISEKGDIRPRKVLTTENDEDLAIYENRFVCSLVHNLAIFVENRYNEITSKMHAFDQTGAGIISSFKLGTSECEIKLGIKVKEEPKNKVLMAENNEKLERIRKLRTRIRSLLATDFIKNLSLKKAVHPPIIKTNIINVNVDYNGCYKLWLFISGYSFAGMTVKYQEKNLPVSNEFFYGAADLCADALNALFVDNMINADEYSLLLFKPIKEKKYRILTGYKFQPEFYADELAAGEDVVNEYYYNAVRNALYKATEKRGFIIEKDLKSTFARFCRSIARINEEMYRHVISSQINREKQVKTRTALRKKVDEINDQQAFLKRFRQLSKLKREEFEKILKAEAREQLKLEKLKRELEEERGERKNARARRKKELERAARIRLKRVAAEKKAKEYETDLREKSEAKIAQTEERKRQKREAAKRRRDLKRLKELKEMYENENP